MLEINKLLTEAMKAKDTLKVECLRAIKNAEMNWKTSTTNVGMELTDAVEMNIIRKLISQYKDTAEQCNDGKHQELVNNSNLSAEYLESFLPPPITAETIEKAFSEIVNTGLEPVKKNMSQFIKYIKAMYPSADGKVIAVIVQSHLS